MGGGKHLFSSLGFLYSHWPLMSGRFMVSFARAQAFIEKGKVFQKPDNMIMKAQRVSDRSRTQSGRFFFPRSWNSKFPFMSTVVRITVGVGKSGNQLYMCINVQTISSAFLKNISWFRVGWLSLFWEKNETTFAVLIATEYVSLN